MSEIPGIITDLKIAEEIGEFFSAGKVVEDVAKTGEELTVVTKNLKPTGGFVSNVSKEV